MSGLRVARLPFLNCDPFYMALPEADMPKLTPSQLGEAARSGQIDAGPISLVDAWELGDEFEPLGELGIATTRRVRSVTLFSRLPLPELEGARIAVTPQTSTSVRLLEVLLGQRHGISAHLEATSAEGFDGRLLIGDEALIAHERGLPGYPVQTDLAAEWWTWRRQPFVFARWMVRRSADAGARADLLASLETGLNSWRARLPEILVRRQALGLLPHTVSDYLNQFNYRLGEAEREGEAAFRSLMAAPTALATAAKVG